MRERYRERIVRSGRGKGKGLRVGDWVRQVTDGLECEVGGDKTLGSNESGLGYFQRVSLGVAGVAEPGVVEVEGAEAGVADTGVAEAELAEAGLVEARVTGE